MKGKVADVTRRPALQLERVTCRVVIYICALARAFRVSVGAGRMLYNQGERPLACDPYVEDITVPQESIQAYSL